MIQKKKRRTNKQIFISTENINLTFANKLDKLKLLFVGGSWSLLNAHSQFVLEAYKKTRAKPNTVIQALL